MKCSKLYFITTIAILIAILKMIFIQDNIYPKKWETNDLFSKEAKEVAIYEALIRGELDVNDDENLIRTPKSKRYPDFYKIKEFERAKENSRFKQKKTRTWNERGPGNISGRVTSLLIDPNDINTWYAGTAGGGIFKTTDYGENWYVKTDDLPNLSITTVATSKANSNIIYAGTGEQFISFKNRGNGLFKSTNGGNTWKRLKSTETADFTYITRIIVNPDNTNSLVVSTRKGIFYSWDGGLSFKKSSGISGKITELLFVPDKFSLQYAALDTTGIYKSTDNGVNWKRIKVLKNVRRITLAISKSNPNNIYGLTYIKNGYSRIFKSPDAGITWYFLDQSKKNDVNVFITGGTNVKGGQGWYDQALVVSPYNSNLFFVGGIDVYKASTERDTVLSIERRTDGYNANDKLRTYVHVDQHAAAYVDKGNGNYDILFGNDGGIYLSKDEGKTFIKKSKGLRNVQFYGASRSPIEKRYFAGAQDNGTNISALNPGKASEWGEKISGDGFNVAWNYADAKQLIGAAQHQTLYKSRDGGKEFTAVSGFFGRGSGPFFNFIATSQRLSDLLVIPATNKLHVSYDFGETWNERTIAGRKRPFSKYSFVVRISDANPSIIWAGDYIEGENRFEVVRNIALSVDAGLTFTQLERLKGVFGSSMITGISTHPTQDSTAYILLSYYNRPHILRTKDLGKTWTNITDNNGFPDVATFDLQVLPHQQNELWAGTEVGLFISYNDGKTWQYSNNTLPAASIRAIHIVKDEILLATHGRGLFTTTIPEHLPSSSFFKPTISVKKHAILNQMIFEMVNMSQNDSMTMEYSIGSNTVTQSLGQKLSLGHHYYMYPINKSGLYAIHVNTYRNNKVLPSETVIIDMTVKNDIRFVDSYLFDFETNKDSTDYELKGLTRKAYSGFSGKALHTPHPYLDKTIYSFIIKKPLQASSGFLKFDEVLIVETGEEEIFDYVQVQASKDLYRWLPLEDKYNSKRYPAWYSAYKSGANVKSSLIRSHIIDFGQFFNKDDVIFIRVQFFTDPHETSWGWLIDNVRVEKNDVSGKNDGPQADMSFVFAQNPSFPKNAFLFVKANLPLYSISMRYKTKSRAEELVDLETFLEEASGNTYLSKNIKILDNETNHFYITTRAFNKLGNPNLSALTDTFSVDAYIINSAEKNISLANIELYFQKNSYDSDTKLLISQYKNRAVSSGKIVEQVSLYTLGKKDLNRTMNIYFSFKGEAKDHSVYQRKSENWEEVSNTARNDKLIISTKELGAYALVKLENSRKDTPKELSYKLEQNYPNPFNPVTVIPFELKKDGHIVLQIYNSIGQKVRTLINHFHLRGSDKIMWDGKNDSRGKVSSGIYFYQLISSEKTITKKMLLLK